MLAVIIVKVDGGGMVNTFAMFFSKTTLQIKDSEK
jgi:hypothetical protein